MCFVFFYLLLLLLSVSESRIAVKLLHCSASRINDKFLIKSYNGNDNDCNNEFSRENIGFNSIRNIRCEHGGKGRCKIGGGGERCSKNIDRNNYAIIFDYNGNRIRNMMEKDQNEDVIDCCKGRYINNQLRCQRLYEYCWDVKQDNYWCFDLIWKHNWGSAETGIVRSGKKIYNNNNQDSSKYIGIIDGYRTYTFNEANSYCNFRFGTKLASFHNIEEEYDMTNMVLNKYTDIEKNVINNNNILIGLIRIHNIWQWIDTSPYDFPVNWKINGPADHTGDNYVCSTMTKDGIIEDEGDCTKPFSAFICNGPAPRRRLNIEINNNIIKRLSPPINDV